MPTKRVILGIHSNLDGKASSPRYNDLNDVLSQFTDGHAWISVTDGRITTRYGLWPDNHPNTKDNGAGTDIRKNMEPKSGKANRYYKLSTWQSQKLLILLARNTTWEKTNNCSSWASYIVTEVTGKDVDADDWLGFETPRELGKSINELEHKSPTTIIKPKELKGSTSWL